MIVGLMVALATIKGWRDWRLFRDTAVESSGKAVQRMHTNYYARDSDTADSGWMDEYYLLVQFMNGQTPIRLMEHVDETRYAAMWEGTTLVIRFAPSTPGVARIQWEPEPPD